MAQYDDSTLSEEASQPTVERIRRHFEMGELISALAVFRELHPGDQAEVLEELGRDTQQAILDNIPPEDSAKIMEEMGPAEAAEVFGQMEVEELGGILDEVAPEVAADVLRQLPAEQAVEALAEMEEGEDVTPLLQYADDTAGGLMTTEYLSMVDDLTVGDALHRLTEAVEEDVELNAVFAVDTENRLLGNISLARLATANRRRLIRNLISGEVISVRPEADQEECARLFERYGLEHLTVTDDDGKLLGVINLEKATDVLQDEATEDMFRLAGVGSDRIFGPFSQLIVRRLPWLYANLATTLLAAVVISLFESTITRAVVLTAFLPVIAGQGGIGDTQTLTLVIRSMALGNIPNRRIKRLLAREVLLGLISGLLLGVTIGVIGGVWKGNVTLGIVLGVSMSGSMLVAGFAGAVVPVTMRAVGMDPALGSAVVVTTVTDVVGFLMYLRLAALVIASLT